VALMTYVDMSVGVGLAFGHKVQREFCGFLWGVPTTKWVMSLRSPTEDENGSQKRGSML
jgi:hypothetical protein